MATSILLICISSITILHCNGALHKQMDPPVLPFAVKNYQILSSSSSYPSLLNQANIGGRRGYYKDRQKLLELDYGVQLSSVENRKPNKKQDSDDGYQVSRLKLGKKIPPVAVAGTPAEIEKLAGVETEATSPATFKSTRCTTDKSITEILEGKDNGDANDANGDGALEAPEMQEVDTGKGGDENGGDKNGGNGNGGNENGGDGNGGNENGGDGNVVYTTEDSGPKDADKVSQNYSRPPGPNVLPDYYVDDQ